MQSRFLGLAVAAALLAPAAVRAQCVYVTGSPQPEQYAANQVKLKYLSTGPGFGDDKPELKKSAFTAPSLGFNPQTVHSVHVTILKTNISGPTMWSTTIPPSTTLWTQNVLSNGNVRWKYNDPLVTFGVKKAQIVAYVGGFHVITKLLGANGNIANAPLAVAVDPVHVLVEIDDGAGNGVCYDGGTQPCTGSSNTQTCKAL